MRMRSVLGWAILVVAYALLLGMSAFGLYATRAKEVQRDSYTITAPRAWFDITRKADRDETFDGTPDLVLEGPNYEDGLPSSRIVVARDPAYAQPSVDRMAQSLVDLASTEAAEASPPRFLTVDGERAALVDFHGSVTERDGPIAKRRVVTGHGGRTWTVTLIAAEGRFPAHALELDELLRGWAWRP